MQEYDNGSASPSVEYIRGSDYGGGVGGIFYTLRTISGTLTPSYTHENRRGDVIAKTNGAGTLTYQAQYEAFGNQTLATGTTLDRQKSNSKDTDPTGLVDEGFRYRDLETGMFFTRDPAGFVDGPNLYTYVVQNPWSGFDAEGLLTLMLNGQEVPWTVGNQARAFVQNAREMLGGMGEQSQALGSAAMHPVATVENVASNIKSGASHFYNDPIGATALSPDAFSPRNVGKAAVNLAAGEVGGEFVGPVVSTASKALGDGAKALTKSLTPSKSALQTTEDTITVLHGTNADRAASLMQNGPDPSFRGHGDPSPAGGFSVTTPHGAEVEGMGGFSAQDYAHDTSKVYGGDPVVLSITMPRSIYNQGAGDMTEMRFENGSGLESVQQNWNSFDKHVTPVPKEKPATATTGQ